MSGATVRLQNVTKRYGERAVVRGVDLSVEGGELVAILGASGCGKTTTLEMVNRMVAPDEGQVLVDDVDVTAMEAHLLRRGIGYVFQDVGLFPHLNVGENIGITPRLLGWEAARIRARTSELLDEMELEAHFAERMPHELSGGQQQRVAVARALAASPTLVLFDEPFAALDPPTRARLGDLVLAEKGRFTALFVTHDVAEAFRLGDRVAVMDAGELVTVGTPDVLRQSTDPRIVSLLAPALRDARALLERS